MGNSPVALFQIELCSRVSRFRSNINQGSQETGFGGAEYRKISWWPSVNLRSDGYSLELNIV